jgi:hypothetical protein
MSTSAEDTVSTVSIVRAAHRGSQWVRSSQLAVGADDADAKNYIRTGLSIAALYIAAIIPRFDAGGRDMAKVADRSLVASGCWSLGHLHDQLACLPHQPRVVSAFRNSLSCETAMLERILVTSRGARARRAPMHAPAPFAVGRGRPAGCDGASTSAPAQRKHRP